jgi:hypothetical protein
MQCDAMRPGSLGRPQAGVALGDMGQFDMAKASITSDMWRCHPCQDRVQCASGRVRSGGLRTVFDDPAMPFNSNERLDW